MLFLVLISTFCFAQDEPVVASIEITPEEATVVVGEEVKFSVVAKDSEGTVIDATIVWSVEGDIGEIDEFSESYSPKPPP